jgi:pyruvate dehydrogenase E1 component alpha subunit
MERCPIRSFEKKLIANNLMTEKEFDSIKLSIEQEVEEAISFAKESPRPVLNEDELIQYVFKGG